MMGAFRRFAQSHRVLVPGLSIHPSIFFYYNQYVDSARGGSSLTREAQTSSLPSTSSRGDTIPKPAEKYNLSADYISQLGLPWGLLKQVPVLAWTLQQYKYLTMQCSCDAHNICCWKMTKADKICCKSNDSSVKAV